LKREEEAIDEELAKRPAIPIQNMAPTLQRCIVMLQAGWKVHLPVCLSCLGEDVFHRSMAMVEAGTGFRQTCNFAELIVFGWKGRDMHSRVCRL